MGRDLEKDLAICEAATPGPWKIDDGDSEAIGIFDSNGNPICYFSGNPERGVGLHGRIVDKANARFAAEARVGWPYAIRYAMSLEREVDRLQNELHILQEQLEQRRCGA